MNPLEGDPDRLLAHEHGHVLEETGTDVGPHGARAREIDAGSDSPRAVVQPVTSGRRLDQPRFLEVIVVEGEVASAGRPLDALRRVGERNPRGGAGSSIGARFDPVVALIGHLLAVHHHAGNRQDAVRGWPPVGAQRQRAAGVLAVAVVFADDIQGRRRRRHGHAGDPDTAEFRVGLIGLVGGDGMLRGDDEAEVLRVRERIFGKDVRIDLQCLRVARRRRLLQREVLIRGRDTQPVAELRLAAFEGALRDHVDGTGHGVGRVRRERHLGDLHPREGIGTDAGGVELAPTLSRTAGELGAVDRHQ